MLTDEELKELESAVGSSIQTKDWNRDRFNALLRYGRKQSGPWDYDISESEEWNRGDIPDDDDTDLILKCVDFTRNAIARERAMRQPLTAEICERLGMVSDQPIGYCKRWQIGESNYVIDIKSQFIGRGLNGASAFAWGNNREPLTVGHLFAAAKLAGVELDWRKVGE